SRHNEQFNRVKTKSANGIQLFVDLHGTNLCGKRTGRSPGQQNSGQQNAELPKERKGHQVDGVDGGTKSLKHRSAQTRDNGPHQKGQQRDDRQGIQAGVVNGGNERRKAPARRTGKNEKQRGEGFPDKAGKLPGEPGNRGGVLPEFSEK